MSIFALTLRIQMFLVIPICAKLAQAQEEPQLLARYRQVAMQGGDSARGKLIFESPMAQCAACHVVAGNDRKAGPPLATIGDKLTVDQLITSILEPNAMIHPDYGRITVATKDGIVVAGVLNRRTEDAIELFNVEGKLKRIKLSDVDVENKGGPSLMPQGLSGVISEDQFADLIAYVSSLKQIVPDRLQRQGLVEDIPVLSRTVQLQPLHEPVHRFDFPVCVLPVPGISNQFVIVEHKSRKVWRLIKDPSGDRKELFADVSAEAISGEFEGVVCMAFHPKYLQNGKYYLNYHVREEGVFSPVIVERVAASDRLHDSGQASRRLLRIKQDTDLHWGGMIAFGPDGYLYIGAGDGGPQEDPDGNSQNLQRWLGSILRIDVDHTTDGKAYAIPSTNPYATSDTALPEIWASGLRMPWRFSFDSLTGELWVGDIGQNLFEEVSIVRSGEDHGWNVYEGFADFSERYRRAGVDYIPPLFSYRRKHGVSVTGGYVYRGLASPSYRGVYICGDFESKHIWGLTERDRKLEKIRQIGDSPEKISSFGMDADGELLLVGYQGTIYRLILNNSTFE